MIPKPTKKKKKPKGEQKQMFLEIWEEREHVSELSGKYLGEESNSWFFAHILSKGAYPHLKLVKENIMLLTKDEHWQVDQNTHLAKENKLFQPFFDKAEELKIKYR
jgi:hypothetical protein